ncbi:Ca2+-dependent phosphoinositide-specific phospholipase C [Streptomyces virginiae]|uniref:Ca2+-dependent phosphoinositide-specific phospholipase C n=1 Tax=Streptomyces virginiae TaxID=1961 RepID=UPI0038272CDC
MPARPSGPSKPAPWAPPTLALLLAAWLACGAPPAAATATVSEDTKLDRITFSGNHNAYEKATYGRLTDALEAGSRLLEIDVYTDPVSGWVVSHSNPLSSNSNCTRRNIFDKEVKNGDLADCLTDLRRWSEAHPGHDPVYVKLEMKWGFYGRADMAPADLDRLIAKRLGSSRVFKPADLTGTAYPDADAATRADAWPSLARTRGRFLFYVWPGTVEGKVFEDNVPTDVEYGRSVRDRAAAGRLMWMGFADQQVAGSAQAADITFRRSGLTTTAPGDYFDHGAVQHLSHVILDLKQFYDVDDAGVPGDDAAFSERVQYMFRSTPPPSPGNADQITDGGGPAFLPNTFRGTNDAEASAQGKGTPEGERRIGHLSGLQRSSRRGDGRPLHLRMDGPGYDAMDVPDGSAQPKLQFTVFVPTADFFSGMRTHQASLDLAAKYGVPEEENGLERFLTATRRQNFLTPPRRHRAFPLVELI